MAYRQCLRIMIIPFILGIFTLTSHTQIRPGIKFGVSKPDVDPKGFVIANDQGVEYYHVYVKNARFGVHAGAFIQMQLGFFFIQPEILYNSTSIDYGVDTLFRTAGTRIFRDTYRNIDFPVILGLKAGPVRIGGGPVGHIFFESQSGFNDYDSFEPFFDDLTWGWQAGVGLDIWKLHIDARYEGNFSQLGDHITFYGRKFDFDTGNNRLIASLGFSF